MKASVSISKTNGDVVRIRLRDKASGIEFAVAEMSVEAFGHAITGLAEQPADIEVRGLQWVGMNRHSERRSIEYTGQRSDRKLMSEWLAENAKEDGWIVDTYLGSQGSVVHLDGKTILNYRVTRYEAQDA